MKDYLTCPYCGKKGYKNLPSHTRQKHGKDLKALLSDFPGIEYEHPEYVNNKINSIKESCRTEEHRKLQSDITRQYYVDHPEMRKVASDKIKEQMASGNIRLRSGYEALKRHCDLDPEFAKSLHKRHSEFMKESWKENREQIISDIKSGWTEDIRKKQSEITRKNWKNPDIAEKMLSGREQDKKVYSSVLKKFFRSSWEVGLAESFHKRNIAFEYEKHWFLYNSTHHYVPDFYLPAYDLFIEVKPVRRITNIVVDKIKAVRDKGKTIILCTENELFGDTGVSDFINKIVELKLCELLETCEGYMATAQSVTTNANA